MTDVADGQSVRDDLSCVADFLDEIEVDSRGKCKWADVANAQTHIRAALRCWAATAPKARPVPAPVGLEREEIKRALALKFPVRIPEAVRGDLADFILALSPDHRTEPAVTPSNPDRGEPVAWQYQRKVGWGDVWRLCDVDPYSPGFFETPEDWRIRPLYSHPPVSAEREALEKAFGGVSDRTWSDLQTAIDRGTSVEFAREWKERFAMLRAALSSTDGRSSAGQSDRPDDVQETYLIGGPPDLRAMSGSVESDRIIQLHFRRRATDDDRKWLLDAINAKLLADREGPHIPVLCDNGGES